MVFDERHVNDRIWCARHVKLIGHDGSTMEFTIQSDARYLPVILAEGIFPEDSERAEAEANARLIAAAPELYEAAVRALEEMCHTTAPRSSFTDAVDTLDAAITKARGEP